MNEILATELLKNPDVLKEIHRHLWLESQKAGYDIGLAWAAEDWMNRYAQAWLDYHMPGQKVAVPAAKVPVRSRHPVVNDGTPERIKKRRAKSYLRH